MDVSFVINAHSLPPASRPSVHDDAAPVAPSLPAKETRVRKGKTRRETEGAGQGGEEDPVFAA